jgi:uncharacterized protein
MKVSRYNITHVLDDGLTYTYNSFSGALAKTNEDFAKLIQYVASNTDVSRLSAEDSELLQRMEKAGFVIDDSIDEIEKYKDFQENQKRYMDTIHAIIGPTLNCNFACKYCFEPPSTNTMCEKIQVATIDFFKNQILKNGAKKFSLVWFGGEPLLQKNIIYNMSTNFISFCNDNNIKFSASIITNGYLINNKAAVNLSKCGIESAQITVDGTEFIHNKRRFLKTDNALAKGTYTRIIENINILIHNNIKVQIRMNTDTENYHNISSFVKEMSRSIPNKEMVSINLGYVSHSDDVSKEYDHILTLQDFAQLKVDALKLYKKYGFHETLKRGFPKLKANYCGACGNNIFVIDPNGNIFRCWEDICHVAYNIGNVYNFDDTNYVNENRHKWSQYSPLNKKKCINCNVLPICGGGCSRAAIHFEEDSRCDPLKYNITKLIEYYALYNLNTKEVSYGIDH